MKNNEVLHIVQHDRFIPDFLELFLNGDILGKHVFSFTHKGKWAVVDEKVIRESGFEGICKILNVFYLNFKLNSAEKIFLHGLFDSKIIFFLFLQPWLLKRCYWVIWGGDLYTYSINNGGWKWRIKEFFRRPVIKKIGSLVTYVYGDVELSRKWYGALGVHRNCLAYPSNTFEFSCENVKEHQGINVLLGNSADPSNQHVELIDLISSVNKNKIFIPLSYGDKIYAKKIIKYGNDILGKDFYPLTEHMSYKDYMNMLSEIDVAIFNHRRQQGMGNIIALLGMGKSVYLRSDTSSWKMLKDMGFNIRDTLHIDGELRKLDQEEIIENKKIIEMKFSRENLINQWSNIFGN